MISFLQDDWRTIPQPAEESSKGSSGICSPTPPADVGGASKRELSAEELELHIRHCGELIEKSMQVWCVTGCFAARGEADYWRQKMYEAIALRRVLMKETA